MTTRYDALTPRPKKDGGTFWHRVGSAFADDKGITVYLDSAPYPDKEGRVVIKLWEPRERAPATRSAPADMGQAIEDEIPF